MKSPAGFSARLRILLVLPAVAALLGGMLSGLGRLGIGVPLFFLTLVGVHGALMVGGFFGTLIGLERAVALARGWAYLAPLFSGLATLCLLADPASRLGPVMLVLAAAAMTAACASVWRRQPAAHHATLLAGALSWLVGNLVWLLGASLVAAVPLWAAFLILTIAGERLELSRFVPTPPHARRLFAAIVALLMAAALVAAFHDAALEIYALALLMLAAWLLRYDIARRTIHSHGLTRYMAACLLSGYLWLALAAVLGLSGGMAAGSPLRDASLHALLLGFVFAMVFGHAPVIVPALTRLRMRWHGGFYVPLVLLHMGLLVRVASLWSGDFSWRQWGALGNAFVLVMFVAMVLESLYAAGIADTRRKEMKHGSHP